MRPSTAPPIVLQTVGVAELLRFGRHVHRLCAGGAGAAVRLAVEGLPLLAGRPRVCGPRRRGLPDGLRADGRPRGVARRTAARALLLPLRIRSIRRRTRPSRLALQLFPRRLGMYTHEFIHAYIHTYVHTYIRTYIHTYIHTYTQTCTQNIPYTYCADP